jgi:hypothetical protein
MALVKNRLASLPEGKRNREETDREVRSRDIHIKDSFQTHAFSDFFLSDNILPACACPVAGSPGRLCAAG